MDVLLARWWRLIARVGQIERAIGVRPALPGRVGDLFGRKESYVELAGDYATTRDYVLGHAARSGAA